MVFVKHATPGPNEAGLLILEVRMAGQPVCLVCKKDMEPGFIIDRTDTGATMQRWCPGTPKEPTKWLGIAVGDIATSQMATGVKVVAYRCPECEALRLYAPSTK